jgi:hypothetical protein
MVRRAFTASLCKTGDSTKTVRHHKVMDEMYTVLDGFTSRTPPAKGGRLSCSSGDAEGLCGVGRASALWALAPPPCPVRCACPSFGRVRGRIPRASCWSCFSALTHVAFEISPEAVVYIRCWPIPSPYCRSPAHAIVSSPLAHIDYPQRTLPFDFRPPRLEIELGG